MRRIQVTLRRLPATFAVMVLVLVLAGSNSAPRLKKWPKGGVAAEVPGAEGPKVADANLPPRDRTAAKPNVDASADPQAHFSHKCDWPVECYTRLKQTIDGYIKLAEYHDAMHIRYTIPHTDVDCDETVLMPTPRSTWHLDLAVKYARAAAHPWLPVAPDPPEPK